MLMCHFFACRFQRWSFAMLYNNLHSVYYSDGGLLGGTFSSSHLLISVELGQFLRHHIGHQGDQYCIVTENLHYLVYCLSLS